MKNEKKKNSTRRATRMKKQRMFIKNFTKFSVSLMNLVLGIKMMQNFYFELKSEKKKRYSVFHPEYLTNFQKLFFSSDTRNELIACGLREYQRIAIEYFPLIFGKMHNSTTDNDTKRES